jgi:hypothetical protein
LGSSCLGLAKAASIAWRYERATWYHASVSVWIHQQTKAMGIVHLVQYERR